MDQECINAFMVKNMMIWSSLFFDGLMTQKGMDSMYCMGHQPIVTLLQKGTYSIYPNCFEAKPFIERTSAANMKKLSVSISGREHFRHFLTRNSSQKDQFRSVKVIRNSLLSHFLVETPRKIHEIEEIMPSCLANYLKLMRYFMNVRAA